MSQIFSAVSVPLPSAAKPFPAASKPMPRRHLLAAFGLIGAATVAPRLARAATDPLAVEVWKDTSCGCCKDWVAHMQDNGFAVTVHESGNNAVRSRLGLPQKLGSCHTALVGGYLIEGHVPAGMCASCWRKSPRRSGWPCPACRWVRREWTAPPMAAGVIPTTCCWWRVTATPACSAATAER